MTTKFFGMKINKYMHDHGISHETLARVAAKNYRNGVLNPNAFRRKPLSEEEILASPMLNYPLTQYMFCSPDEGAAAVVLCRAEDAHRYTRHADLPARHRPCGHAGSVRSRCTARGSRSRRPWARPSTRRSAAYEMAGHRAGGRRRDPAPGHRRRARRSSTSPRTASAPTASRRRWSPTARSRSAVACRSTPTAGSSRTASRSARRACGRCTRSCSSCAGRRGSGRCPGTRRSDTRSSTARPAPPACRSSPPDAAG